MQGNNAILGAKSLTNGGDDIVEVLSSQGRNIDAAFVEQCELSSSRAGNVGLIEDQQLGHLVGVDLTQHIIDGRDLALGIVTRPIDDVHEEISQLDRLQRTHERLDQVVGQ